MPLDPARWELVKTLFGELAGLPAADREARLDALKSDSGLRDELRGLLAAADSVGDRFESVPGLIEPVTPAPSLVGQRLGVYAVVSEIGRGGMGTVYLGERADDVFTRQVAIKTIAAGFGAATVIGRFRQERQILARLDHPNVALLLDGGVTANGMPYLVMEYVQGEPIDRWCAARQADVRTRLRLFGQVCRAVQYAHERLIIHRDIKPANILVSADGAAKLLDFGIAKLLDPADADDTLTQTGVLPMTAAYASPEQLLGEPATVTTDVYALGLVLYELLAGRRAFAPSSLPAAIAGAATRTVTAPSRVVTSETSSAAGMPDAARLRRVLTGELDAIVLKALRPEPARRYHSAAQLADDIERYLQGRPVMAQPDTARYRLRKFVARNRMAVAAAAVAVLALIGGTAASLRQAAVARAQRDAAVREQRRTEQVTQFFRDVLTTARPAEGGRSVTVVEAIDRVIPRIDSTFRNQPDLRAAIKNTLGSTLTDMYLYDRARPLAEDALRLRREIDEDRPSREQADALYNLAGIEAEAGSPVRAESLYRASIAMYRRLPGIDSSEITRGLNNLAGALSAQGRLEEAIALYQQEMRSLGDALVRDTMLHGVLLGNTGTAQAQLGRYIDAERNLEAAVALLQSMDHPNYQRIASELQPLAGTRLFLGKLESAESAARQSWDLNRRELGDDNPGTIVSLRMLVNILADEDRCREALPLARRILALRGRTLGDRDPSVGTALLFAGWCRSRLGEPEAGARDVSEGLALRRQTFGDRHWAVAAARSMLGDVLSHVAGRDDDALRELRLGYDGLRATLDPGNARVRQAGIRLRNYYQARGRPAEARRVADSLGA